MQILIGTLTVLDVIIAVLLIGLILVQQSKEGGFGTPFGGMGESVFGVQTASHLAKLTVIFSGAFLIITLTLTVITGHRNVGASKGMLDKEPVTNESGKEAKNDTAKTPVTSDATESTEVLEDGTIVKKVQGGTITMKPVKSEDALPTNATPDTNNNQPGNVSVTPIADKNTATDPEDKEETTIQPDGTIIKKVQGGTIMMKPVKKDEIPPPITEKTQTPEPEKEKSPEPKPAE